MELTFDPTKKVTSKSTETYMAFRDAVMKPSDEDAHLRHILRFYMARAMLKRGEKEVFVLPELTVDDKTIRVDLAAGAPGKYAITLCEPGSIQPDTEAILEVLKDIPDIEVFIVHSQYGKPGKVETKFSEQLVSKKFHLLAVVPPPFDDVYEYDIWMFETTFRNLFEGI